MSGRDDGRRKRIGKKRRGWRARLGAESR